MVVLGKDLKQPHPNPLLRKERVPEQQGNTNKSTGGYPAVTEGQNLVVATYQVATHWVAGDKTKN